MARDDETLASFFGDRVAQPVRRLPNGDMEYRLLGDDADYDVDRDVEPGPNRITQPATDEEFAAEEVDEPVEAPTPALTVHDAALVAEACAKSGLVWLRPVAAPRSHPAWHVWHEGAVTVVFGVDEQMLPMLDGEVEVTVPSKDTRQRLVTFLALGEVVPVSSPEWDAAATALSAARLNARDPEEQRARWAAGTLIVRLTPLYLLSAGAGTSDEPSTAATPAGNAGTTIGRRPWHLRGRTRRRQRS